MVACSRDINNRDWHLIEISRNPAVPIVPITVSRESSTLIATTSRPAAGGHESQVPITSSRESSTLMVTKIEPTAGGHESQKSTPFTPLTSPLVTGSTEKLLLTTHQSSKDSDADGGTPVMTILISWLERDNMCTKKGDTSLPKYKDIQIDGENWDEELEPFPGKKYGAVCHSTSFFRASPILQRFVPFAAVCASNMVNIPLMRQSEIQNGVVVTDEDNNPVTKSKMYRKLTEMLLPFLMEKLEKTAFMVRYGRYVNAPFQILLSGLSSITVDKLKIIDSEAYEEVKSRYAPSHFKSTTDIKMV
uniref:Sideroflexin-2 n=1 Tax=Magallana gigas TaxID=29159 RepID=K1QNV9_MAGGI